MAIGMGKMFGFTFMENFNFPYTAQSLRDFWKRWHIFIVNLGFAITSSTFHSVAIVFPRGGLI